MKFRRRRFALALRNADTPRRPPRPPRASGGRLRHPLRGSHFYPKPKAPRPARSQEPTGPRMRPRRSVVDRVMTASEPSAPRTVIRLRVLGVVVAALFSLMFIRLWYLQVLDTSAYSKTVTANQVRDVEVPAPRGLITDRNDNIIVGDQVTQDITLSRVAAQEHPAVVGQLAALLGIPSAQIESDLANVQYSLYKPVPILESAPLPDVLYIGEHASMFPGVSTVADTNRTYPLGQTGVQMLGYVDQISSDELAANKSTGYQLGDLYGQSGLENQYESYLRGRPGLDKVEVNAHGQVVGSLGEAPPSAGDDVVTNIDSGLEQTLQQALDAQIASLKGKATEGAAVALDPQTGAVLALVSSPTYDPTWWTNGISTAHFTQIKATGALNNNAIQGLYTPGSTFKLATATAALQTGLISPSFTYDDTGSYTVPGCAVGGVGCTTYHDNEGEVGGRINVSQALTVSSDIFFYNLGVEFWGQQDRYGKTPIQDAAHQLGYGDVTGIDLPDETHVARVDSPDVVARARPGPHGLPQRQMVHREQPRARLRSGRHGDHTARAGRGLRHVRQRRDPLRPADRGGHGERPRQGAPHRRPQGGRPRQLHAHQLPGHAPGLRGRGAEPQGHRLRSVRRLPSVHLPPGGQDRDGHHQRAAAQLVVRGLGPTAESPVPDRRGGPRRRIGVRGRRARGAPGIRLPGGASRRTHPPRRGDDPGGRPAPTHHHDPELHLDPFDDSGDDQGSRPVHPRHHGPDDPRHHGQGRRGHSAPTLTGTALDSAGT